jgi:hypothetical protein
MSYVCADCNIFAIDQLSKQVLSALQCSTTISSDVYSSVSWRWVIDFLHQFHHQLSALYLPSPSYQLPFIFKLSVFAFSISYLCREQHVCYWLYIWYEYLILVDPCIIVQFVQKNPTRCNTVSKFIITYLYEAQHVSGDTPPIIRSLKLH